MPAEAEWEGLARRGRTVEAIKSYQLATGVGVAEAKAAVERWIGVNLPASPSYQRAQKVARRVTEALVDYAGGSSARLAYQVSVLPADPAEVVGHNTLFFAAGPADNSNLDLAVEVVMTGVSDRQRDEVVRRHQADGAQLVCVLDPDARTVVVYRGGPTGTGFDADDTLDGGDVLPGFSCRVADFFA